MAQKLKAIAFHEAGHAVMCWCEGVAVRTISILPEDEVESLDSISDTGSHCHMDLDPRPKKRSRMEKLVKVCLAGPYAQRRYQPRSHWRADGEYDFGSAAELINSFTGSDREAEAYLHLLEIQTQQELEHENIWMRVEALASALVEKKKLSARKIRSILKDPPISAQRLEQIMKYAMPIPFPEVSRIEVELTECGPGTNNKDRSRGFVWPQTYVSSIQCSNASICAGNLDLAQIIAQMVDDQADEREVLHQCSGGDDNRPCPTSFNGSVRLSYVE